MRRHRLAALALAITSFLAGCAPVVRRPPAGPDVRELRTRFEAALGQRAGRDAADAELSAWPGGTALPRLPGVSAQLVLRAPDAFRLRVGSLFGVALDLAARGDSLTAYIPSRRLALDTATSGDTLGLADPGWLGYRLWSATWDPPASAWGPAAWQDSLLVLNWSDDGDSVALAVGANGLPRWVERGRAGRVVVRADYEQWSFHDGVAWPIGIMIQDRGAEYTLRCRVREVRFRENLDPGRLQVRVPDDAQHVTRDDLRRALQRWGKS